MTRLPEKADKPLVWLEGEIKTPPFSDEARRTAGFLLRALQRGRTVLMPHSRPMPTIGSRCHELRIQDSGNSVIWRVIYRTDVDAIVIGEIFAKKTRTTPQQVIDNCIRRFRKYDAANK